MMGGGLVLVLTGVMAPVVLMLSLFDDQTTSNSIHGNIGQIYQVENYQN